MNTVEMAEVGAKESWRRTTYLIDCHCHIGAGPTVAKLAEDPITDLLKNGRYANEILIRNPEEALAPPR